MKKTVYVLLFHSNKPNKTQREMPSVAPYPIRWVMCKTKSYKSSPWFSSFTVSVYEGPMLRPMPHNRRTAKDSIHNDNIVKPTWDCYGGAQ